jgi:competence protein ComEC
VDSYSLRRDFVILRQFAPALPLCIVVLVAQVAFWFVPHDGLLPILLGLGTLIIYFRGTVLQSLLVGALVAISVVYLGDANRQTILPQKDVSLVGKVVSIPRRRRPGEITFLFRTTSKQGKYTLRCRAVDLPWRSIHSVGRDDIVVLRGKIAPIQKPDNPFSWKGWLWRQGVSGEMKVKFASIQLSAKRSILQDIRSRIRNHIHRLYGDSRGGNLFLSMSLGYQDNLSQAIEGAFKRLGLTHLLVVSGYQVTLMYTFVVWLLSRAASNLSRNVSFRRSIGIAGLLCALLYVLFIGSEFSGIRAMLAASSVGIGWMCGRPTSFLQRCSIALLVMQILWPLCIFDIGVVLTFSALLGIGLGAARYHTQPWRTFLAVNVLVWMTTTFVIVAWQGTVSTIGLLVNIAVAGPWSIINCTVGIIGLFLSLLGIEFPMSLVIKCNFWVSELILFLGESRYSQLQLEGSGRLVVLVLLLLYPYRRIERVYRQEILSAH